MNVEISDRTPFSTILLNGLSSSKLALVLVLLLILLSIAGAILPQEGMLEPTEIALWQGTHPALTLMLRPFGLFHVFRSWPFLATIFLLGVNTLTCTVLHLLREGGLSVLKGPGAIERLGFLLVHLSLIGLLSGGLWSAAARLNGFIVLTEGQRGLLAHQDGSFRLLRGRFRPERDGEFLVFLKKVNIEYERKRYPITVTSNLEILSHGREAAEGEVKFNEPITYNGLTFAQRETGFSPRLVIRYKGSGRLLLDSFVALKTFGKGAEREYRDFVPLPFLKQRVIITFYPSFSRDNGTVRKGGDEPDSPLLLIEMEDGSGRVVSHGYLPAGGRLALGEYSFLFAGLRRWAAFQVVQDPGYPIVMVSLWLGMGALVLRYLPDLGRWFKEAPVRRGAHGERGKATRTMGRRHEKGIEVTLPPTH